MSKAASSCPVFPYLYRTYRLRGWVCALAIAKLTMYSIGYVHIYIELTTQATNCFCIGYSKETRDNCRQPWTCLTIWGSTVSMRTREINEFQYKWWFPQTRSHIIIIIIMYVYLKVLDPSLWLHVMMAEPQNIHMWMCAIVCGSTHIHLIYNMKCIDSLGRWRAFRI